MIYLSFARFNVDKQPYSPLFSAFQSLCSTYPPFSIQLILTSTFYGDKVDRLLFPTRKLCKFRIGPRLDPLVRFTIEGRLHLLRNFRIIAIDFR